MIDVTQRLYAVLYTSKSVATPLYSHLSYKQLLPYNYTNSPKDLVFS